MRLLAKAFNASGKTRYIESPWLALLDLNYAHHFIGVTPVGNMGKSAKDCRALGAFMQLRSSIREGRGLEEYASTALPPVMVAQQSNTFTAQRLALESLPWHPRRSEP